MIWGWGGSKSMAKSGSNLLAIDTPDTLLRSNPLMIAISG
ncbi:hypothetical protein CARN8_3790004 [mine drainage metagenome]|uniref:Uncharacterized protein n=1 Tax=mine drainage metagenome TaxID=410659 RepID=A0A3P3ZPU8_9ZZZZ